ncbi:MAG: DNA repair protein RadC [Bacteroidales bacterium]|jgi:DNA repair protein RadC
MKYDKFSTPWQVNDSAPAKLLQIGSSSLSNSELISVAIGITADQARQLLQLAGNDLHALAKMPVSEISKVDGISTGKALRISAVFEIGRRRRATPASIRPKVRCSQDAFHILEGVLADLQHEEFWIVLLNRSNQVIETVRISQGGISGTVTDVRLILNAAVEKLASGIILAHNHPSGNLSPSEADLKITKKIKDASALLDLSVLDHIIISDHGYLSMADDNLMPS